MQKYQDLRMFSIFTYDYEYTAVSYYIYVDGSSKCECHQQHK